MRAFALFACLFSAAAVAAPPSLATLLKPAQYDDVLISPDGRYLVATVTLEDRSVMVVMNRADGKLSTRIDPGKNGYVDGAFWVTNERIFVRTSFRVGQNEGTLQLPQLYAVDADGGNRRLFDANVVDTLPGNDEHVLISRCTRATRDGCHYEVRRTSVNSSGGGKLVVKGPVINASFTTDNKGEVRLVRGEEAEGRARTYVRNPGDEEWTLLNEEEKTNSDIYPIGTSADDRVAYLQTEVPEGPDVVETYEFATGKRTVVMRDAVADPFRAIYSNDGREPIGAWYGPGIPRARFWHPKHPDAVLAAELVAMFPGEYARVTSASEDGALAVITVSSDRDPGRFYLFDSKAGDIKLLNKRRPDLATDALAKLEPIELKARDGTPLHGFLALPPGIAPRDLPLVVLPHGGPYWVLDDWSFDEDTQVLATRGYAVLRVNFRGSGGFGRAFLEQGFGEWGGTMQDDLTDATRWAIDQGIADPRRICMYGASYGGYAALMGAVKEPDLYRCVIGVAGPYDLDLMLEWGDIQRTRYGERYLDRALGTDAKVRAQRSPARRAKEIKASVMLVHGGRDKRVSPQHAGAMKKALDDAGVRNEGYFPSYEAHGIAGKDNQIEYYEKILAFLDRHLNPGGATATTRDAEPAPARQ